MSTKVFIGGFSATSKKTNKPFNKIDIAELVHGKARVTTLFTEDNFLDKLQFGDIIDLEYEQGYYINSKPKITDIIVLESSPYTLPI